MKRKELEKELLKVLDDAKDLQTASELHLATADFLRKEGNKLMKKADDPTLPYDQKEEVTKQMIALKKRLESELIAREKDTPKIMVLDDRFNELKTIFETGQFEN